MSFAAVGSKLDDVGRPAWIAVMVFGFVAWWPLGLATLGYLIWSGRMGCQSRGSYRWENKMQRMQDKMERMRGGMSGRGGGFWGGQSSSGNAAFDEYKAETLRRLEEEQHEFRSFLDRLRMTKDRAEFDQFMADRRRNETPRDDSGAVQPQA